MLYAKPLTPEFVAADDRLRDLTVRTPIECVRFVKGGSAADRYEALVDAIDEQVSEPELVTFTTDTAVARDPRFGLAALTVARAARFGDRTIVQNLQGALLAAARTTSSAPHRLTLRPEGVQIRIARDSDDEVIGRFVGTTARPGPEADQLVQEHRLFMAAIGRRPQVYRPFIPFAFVSKDMVQPNKLLHRVAGIVARNKLPVVEIGPLHYRLETDRPLY